MIEDIQLRTLSPSVRWLPLRSPTLPPATHTNVWVLGATQVTVIDPGTPNIAELERLVRAVTAAGAKISNVWLTHHHWDHVSGAEWLRKTLDIPVLCHPLTRDRVQGKIVIADTFDEGAELSTADSECTARAIFTPGHAPGHIAFWLPQQSALIAGDLIAGVGFIVVDPDDAGDMSDYLASLERIRKLPIEALLPAHGEPLRTASESIGKITEYIEHRLAREAKVLKALQTFAAPISRVELLPRVYADVPTHMHIIADRSLAAHLMRLVSLGQATRQGELFAPTAAPVSG